MFSIQLLAQQTEADKWLDKNPLVLGLIFLAIGGLLVMYGVKELKSGVAKDKYGNEITGGFGKLIAGVRLLAGIGLCIFAIYKMIGG